MKNSSGNIEEIKNRCDIVDVIGEVVQLKRAGANYKGVCPFHNEKTPSFVVSGDKQIFTCFGCGATGDVIEFTKKYYSLEFMEAVEKLGERCGITFEASHTGNQKDKEKLYNINREAAIFYFKSFFNIQNPGYKYMEGRGISRETMKKFGIGYADDKWTSLYDYLKKKNISDKDMMSLGLVSEKNGRYYDKFRNRVIFPIQNTAGKVIGFGGRIIGDGMPKYLNSSESDIFHKKNNLYGLNLSKKSIQNEDKVILAEGYMDVIALYDNGIENVTASLGTALTENQSRQLKRYANNIFIAYDADEAGQNAAMRAIEIIKNTGAKGKVVKIPDGKDPDEFLKKHGPAKFRRLLEDASGYGEYRLSKLAEKYDLENMEERIDFLKAAAKILGTLSPVERDLYIKKLSRDTGISEGAIRGEVGENIIEKENSYNTSYDKARIKENAQITTIEKELIKFMLISDKYYKIIINKYREIFESKEGKEIVDSIDVIYEGDKEPDIKKLIDILEGESQKILKYIADNADFNGKEDKAFEECIAKVNIDKLKERAKQLELIITMLDEEEDRLEIEKASIELMEIQQRIRL